MTERAPLAGLDDDTIARLQFDHYIGQVELGQLTGWATARRLLAEALEAAGSGIAVRADRPLTHELLRIAARKQELTELIDGVRRHRPDVTWNEFRTALYEAWRGLDANGSGGKKPW